MTQSVVALFNSFTEANAAKQALITQGISRSQIAVSAYEDEISASHAAGSTITTAHSEGGFMQGVENFFAELFSSSGKEDAGHYSEAVRRGGAVVTVTVDNESEVDNVRSALTSAGAVNIEDCVAAWRTIGYAGYRKNSPPYTADQVAEERFRVIPVIQEELEVGKRQVDLSSVRVVSRIVETPVSESVTLREQHATIERRPVDRPASTADLAGTKGHSIEVRQAAEKAVVSKTARVVEEVVVGKEATTRTEQIADTVRSTVVDVEKTGGSDTLETRSTLHVPEKGTSIGTLKTTDVLKRPAD